MPKGDRIFMVLPDMVGFPRGHRHVLYPATKFQRDLQQVSNNLAAIRVTFGLRIERDVHFEPRHALSVYANAARAAGRIVEHDTALESAKTLLHCAPARR